MKKKNKTIIFQVNKKVKTDTYKFISVYFVYEDIYLREN